MPSEKERLEQLIIESSDLLFELQRRLGTSSDPVEQARLRQDIERQKAHLISLKDQLAALGRAPGKGKGSGLTCPKPPPAPLHFAGRETELAELKQRMKSEKLV